MIDMHCHILPGVDDGAQDLQVAIEMAKVAEENGIKAIFATPHYIDNEGYSNVMNNKKILNNLNDEMREKGITIDIHLGNEVYIIPDILKLLDRGEICTLNGSKYLLLELPMLDIPIYTENVIYDLRLNGFTPIIAHPERNGRIIEDPNIMYNFITHGALVQINLSSLIGYYGMKVKNTAKILLSHDMIHFVGTDAHHFKTRALRIGSAIEVISRILPKEKANRILFDNPKAVINNEVIDIYEPIKYKRKRKLSSMLSFIFS